MLKLCQKYSISKTSEFISISKEATLISGTTASLKENDLLSVWDLLHAMMLPSGNDAAHALAQHFGEIIVQRTTNNAKRVFIK